MTHDGFPYADESAPGNFAYKPRTEEQPMPDISRLPAQGTYWRHYKGGLYKVIGHGIIEATEQLAVIYQDANNMLAAFWIRPVANWHEEVPTHGARFRQVSAP